MHTSSIVIDKSDLAHNSIIFKDLEDQACQRECVRRQKAKASRREAKTVVFVALFFGGIETVRNEPLHKSYRRSHHVHHQYRLRPVSYNCCTTPSWNGLNKTTLTFELFFCLDAARRLTTLKNIVCFIQILSREKSELKKRCQGAGSQDA